MIPLSRLKTLKITGSVLSLSALIMAQASAATITKASGNTTTLNVGSAWVGGTAPGGTDVALFTSASVVEGATTSFQLGGNTTWGQLAQFTQPLTTNTTATVDGNFTLTLNGVNGIGINNLSYQPAGSGNKDATLQIGSGVTVNVANSQIWQAVNRQVNVNGVIAGSSGTTITKTGNGILQLGAGAAIQNTFAGNLVLGGTGNESLQSRWTSLTNLTLSGGTATINQNQTVAGYNNTNLINSSATLTLSGGNLAITGKANTAVSQAFASTTLGGGQSTITFTNQAGTGSTTADLGAITRNVGGLLLYNNTNAQAGTTVGLTSAGTAGMLKTTDGVAYGTIGTGATTSWAARDGSNNIVAYAGYTTVSGTNTPIGAANAGQDVDLSATGTVAVTSTALSTLKLDDTAAARSLTFASGQVLKTGGILALGTTAATSFSGSGTITALDGAHELTVINAGTQQLGLGVAITDNGSPVTVTFGGGTTPVTNIINVQNAGTYTGDTYIAGGTLRMNGNTSGNANSTYRVGGTASFNVNNQNTITIGGISGYGNTTLGNGSLNVGGNNVSTTYDGAFTGSSTSAITKSGTGTLRLTASPVTNTLTYLGAVTVSNGTLLVNGSLANASGFSIANGAALGGIGTVSAITANAGAKIAPGDTAVTASGIGTLTGTTLALTSGTHFVFDLSSTDATSDVLTLTGALTADSGTYAFDFSGGQVGQTYTLLNFASSTGINSGSFTTNGGYIGNFTVNGTSLTFTYTAVPEPSTWGVVGAGFALLAIVRRRMASRE